MQWTLYVYDLESYKQERCGVVWYGTTVDLSGLSRLDT